MKGQELIDFIIDKFDGVMIDDYGWEHHKISGKDYDIRFDRSRLEWKFVIVRSISVQT